MNVVGPVDDIYYATPNQDIYISIHIDNPDSYEILSFTLNGKKYTGYMFEEGSDMETIILKYNVGNTSGIVSYTIDAIKYVDGTAIKDVLIDGNKTVMAGIKTQDQITAKISDFAVETNSVSLEASVKDNDNLVEFSSGTLKAVLYDGENIVEEKDISVGKNQVSFQNLGTNTIYQYAIVGFFDDLSGNGFQMHVLHKDAFFTDSVLLFDNVKVTQTGITFGFVWHKNHAGKTLTSLSLYQNQQLVQSLHADATSIENLLCNNTYQLVAEYPNGNATESISIEFTTIAKATPQVEISGTPTQTSIDFAIDVTDTDSVGSITDIELIHGEDVVSAQSTDLRTFANLLSNNAYTVKVTYTYNLNDGEGDHALTKQFDTTTIAKATPQVEISTPEAGEKTVTAEYQISDADNICIVDSVKILQGENEIAKNDEKKIDFANLNYYTEYTIVVAYTYNLNDGTGDHSQTVQNVFKTLPYLEFDSCKVINTSAVSEGETIYIQATLDNPCAATPISAVVNGKTYTCAGSTSTSKVYLEIVNDGQFEGGDTTLSVEKINLQLDGNPYTVKTEKNNSGTVFINGKLEVASFQLVNGQGEAVDWCFGDDNSYVLLTLKNKTGYSIDSVVVTSDWSEMTLTPTRIDDEHYKIEYDKNYGWNGLELKSISYHNEYLSKTIAIGDCYSNWMYILDNHVEEISTREQLLNTTYNRYHGYYKLTADIDLGGMEWTNLGMLEGVFDGNGHTISNMSNVSTITDTNAVIGLFSSVVGIVQNLNIADVTVLITVTSTTESSYDAYFGGIFARKDNYRRVIVSNCSVTGDIGIKNTTKGESNVGGIIGHYAYCTYMNVKNCNVDTSITVSENSTCSVGGLIGYTHYGTTAVTDCEAKVDVTVNATEYSYVGGLIGYADGTTTATDCEAKVNIDVKNGDTPAGTAGGIIGLADWYSICNVNNCNVQGTIKAANAEVIGTMSRNVSSLEFKNNQCDVYINGTKITEIADETYKYQR